MMQFFCILTFILYSTLMICQSVQAAPKPKKVKTEVEAFKRDDDYPLMRRDIEERNNCLQDFEFSKEATRLHIPNEHLQNAIKCFVEFCKENTSLTMSDLVDKFLYEHQTRFIEIATALSNRSTFDRGFVTDMIRSAYSPNVKQDLKDDIATVIGNKYKDYLQEPGVQQPIRKKRRQSSKEKKDALATAEFSESVIESLAKLYAYRHLAVNEILTNSRPSHFPRLYWDLLTNVMFPIDNCPDTEKPNKSLFELLTSDRDNEDRFLPVAIYLMVKITQTKSFHSNFEYNSMALYLHGVVMEEKVMWVDLSYDAERWMGNRLNKENVEVSPLFELSLNVKTQSELDRAAKDMGLKYNLKRPDFVPRSLWIIIMALHSKLNTFIDQKNIVTFQDLLEAYDKETADFFIACLVIVFHYPSIVNEQCRKSIEYWIQREMIKSKLAHIEWRDEISKYPVPLFYPGFDNQ